MIDPRRFRSFKALCLLALVATTACATNGSNTPQIEVLDVDGNHVSVTPAVGANATVLLFVATDCPIANYFAPEIKRIYATYGAQGVAFYLVYADGDETNEDIATHLSDYGYSIQALLDPEHLLVDHVGASVTPEAAVLDREGELIYLGRINDLYVDFGKQRAKPTREDLKLALDAVLAGTNPEVERAVAIGCFIPDPLPAGS